VSKYKHCFVDSFGNTVKSGGKVVITNSAGAAKRFVNGYNKKAVKNGLADEYRIVRVKSKDYFAGSTGANK